MSAVVKPPIIQWKWMGALAVGCQTDPLELLVPELLLVLVLPLVLVLVLALVLVLVLVLVLPLVPPPLPCATEGPDEPQPPSAPKRTKPAT